MTRRAGEPRRPGRVDHPGAPPRPGPARGPGVPRLPLDWADPPGDLKDRIMAAVRAEPAPSPAFGLGGEAGGAAGPGHAAGGPVAVIPLRRALVAVAGTEALAVAFLVALAARGGLGDLVLGLGRTARWLVEVGGFVRVGLEAAHVTLTQAWWLGALLGAPLAAAAVVLGRWWMNGPGGEEGVPC